MEYLSPGMQGEPSQRLTGNYASYRETYRRYN